MGVLVELARGFPALEVFEEGVHFAEEVLALGCHLARFGHLVLHELPLEPELVVVVQVLDELLHRRRLVCGRLARLTTVLRIVGLCLVLAELERVVEESILNRVEVELSGSFDLPQNLLDSVVHLDRRVLQAIRRCLILILRHLEVR